VLVDERQIAVQRMRQPLGERTGIRFGETPLQLVGGAAQRRLVQLLLAAGEVAVDQGPRDLGGGGDVVQRDVLGSALGEQAQGGGEQLAAALLDAQPAVGGSGYCWGGAAAVHEQQR